MRRQAGYSLLELLIATGVVLGILAGVIALAVSARADSRQLDVTQRVLAVASAAQAQAEYEGLTVLSASPAVIASRSQEVAAMLSADGLYFNAGGTVRITPSGGTLITVTGLSADQCVEAAGAVLRAVPGITGIRINSTTGAFVVTTPGTVAGCALAKPATIRIYL